MNIFTLNSQAAARLLAAFTLITMVLGALATPFSAVHAESTGLNVSTNSLTIDVNEKGNFVASVVDTGTSTPGTVISVDDNGAGGSFYNGTVGGDCNTDTVDADNEFASTGNKGICYSNATEGSYVITVQLLDGPAGSPIGTEEEIDVEVNAVDQTPVATCTISPVFTGFQASTTNPIFDWNLTLDGDVEAITEVHVYRNGGLFSTGGDPDLISAPDANFVIAGGYSHPYNVGLKLLADETVIGECEADLEEVIIPDDNEDNDVLGCTDPDATNYDPKANVDDKSCVFDDDDDDNEEPEECVVYEDWADTVEWSDQGSKKDGSDITDPNRTDDTATLGEADWSAGGNTGFFSLGFGGSIKVGFDNYVIDTDGDDISIHEATNGNNYPLERAEVFVSQDGADWFMIGYADNTANDRVTYLDIASSGLSWIKYVKVVDVSNPDLHVSDADGFDLDAVDATKTSCRKPEPEEPKGMCEIEGHKYDETGNPLKDWFIGLKKFATYGDEVVGYTIMSDETDEDGYYCLEWDEVDFSEVEDGYDSFVYHIFEKLKAGWNFLSIEKGEDTDNLTVVDDEDIWYQDDEVGTQFGEENGYILADTAYHVDFYNQYDQDGGGNGTSTGPFTLTVTITGDGEGSVFGTSTASTTDIMCDGDNLASSTCTFVYASGTVVSLAAIADEGSNFDDSWTTGFGTCTGHNTPCEIVMTQDVDLVAHFGLDSTPTSRGGGGRRSSGTRTSGGDGDGDDTPEGQVLGEQVTVVPEGAPNAGHGGTSPVASYAFFGSVMFNNRRLLK